MEKLLQEKCHKLLDMVNKAGADSCDIILSKGDSFSVSVQNADVDKYKVSGAQVIGVRAIKDSKVGLSYSESLDDSALEVIAKSVIENAENSEVNQFEKIEIEKGEYLFPSGYTKDDSTTEDKIDFCLRLESEVKARDSRVETVPYNGVSEASSSLYYLNSNHVFGYKSDYYQTCYTSALIQEGEKSSMNSHGVVARKLKDLNYERCIELSLEHASQWLHAKPLSTGHYDVIFEPDSFYSFFSCFSNIFSGKGAMEKTNPFSEKLNQQVANSKLTIKDIPQYADAFSKYYFDSEGVARKDFTLIENGKLNSFYHNSATASFFNIETTGHASRGAKSALTVSGTTKVFSGGDIPTSQLTSGEYFEIHSMQGLYSGSNAISGEFSFAASGYLCRDGKRVQPVKGVTVSGNYHQMLLNVELIGSEIIPTEDKEFFAPLFRFEKVSVAGV